MVFSHKSGAQIGLTISESEISDWKGGRISTLEGRGSFTRKIPIDLWQVKSSLFTKALLGVQRRSYADTSSAKLLPTDNEIFTEYVAFYPFQWKVDPYVSFSARTQIMESRSLQGGKFVGTASWWDPAILQEAFGFTVSVPGDNLLWSLRLGAAFKQITALRYTSLTDNPKTQGIKENRKNEVGMECIQEFSFKIDSVINIQSRLSIFRKINNDVRNWSVQWENDINQTIWRFIGIIFRLQFAFDEAQSKKLQYKQSLSLGLVYYL